MSLLERLGVELPLVQAGMGGGLAGAKLAAAVSDAGGLGTLGTGTFDQMEKARERTGKPIAANVLLPFARRPLWEAASRADVVVTFWGEPRRHTDKPWLHQCGSVEEVKGAAAAGADGAIVQGVEAGGHVRGTTPALELLERARAAVREDFPLWLAGGIADAADVRAALDAGAEAAVLGTRFLMSDESSAHPGYKARLVEDSDTVLTEFFGMAWPAAPHRVLWNEAARRWLQKDQRGPGWVRAVNRVTAPFARRIPVSLTVRLSSTQRPGQPFLSPASPIEGMPDKSVEATALYAGQTVGRINDIRPAAEIVKELVEAP